MEGLSQGMGERVPARSRHPAQMLTKKKNNFDTVFSKMQCTRMEVALKDLSSICTKVRITSYQLTCFFVHNVFGTSHKHSRCPSNITPRHSP